MLVPLLLAVIFCSLWAVVLCPVLPHSHQIDFLNLYTGASFALHWDWTGIYDAARQLAQEQLLVPERKTLWPFVRPPFYAILASPLALIPFPIAFPYWIAAQSAMFLASLLWAWKRFGPAAAAWGAFYFATPTGIALGQDCAVYLLILCAAFALAEKNRQFLSGLVIGLGLVKFHLFLLWPLVLLIQQRWRMLAGFTVSGALQGLISLAVIGWSGILHYADFILHLDKYYAPKLNIDINAILLNYNLTSRPLFLTIAGFTAGLILWSSAKAKDLWFTFALATSGSLLLGPHVYGYDGAMLLPALWSAIFVSRSRFTKFMAIVICMPVAVAASFLGQPAEVFMAIEVYILTIALCREIFLAQRQHPLPA